MRKKTFTLAVAVFFLLALGTHFGVVNANPVRLVWVPTFPDSSLPLITIETPEQDATYSANQLYLNFNVNLPESWFNNDPTGSAPIGHYCNGKIREVQVMIDDLLSQSILVNNDSYLPYSSDFLLPHSLSLTTDFTVGEGKHVVVLKALGESYYNPKGDLTVLRNPISADSSPVIFYVMTSIPNSSLSPSTAPTPTQEPTLEPTLPRPTPSLPYPPSASPSPSPTTQPTPSPSLSPSPTMEPTLTPTLTSDDSQDVDWIPMIPAAVVVVAVAVGALIYFKRRK